MSEFGGLLVGRLPFEGNSSFVPLKHLNFLNKE
jgi:hypothetical protein